MIESDNKWKNVGKKEWWKNKWRWVVNCVKQLFHLPFSVFFFQIRSRMDTLILKYSKSLLKRISILNSAFLQSNGHQIIRIYQKNPIFEKKFPSFLHPLAPLRGCPIFLVLRGNIKNRLINPLRYLRWVSMLNFVHLWSVDSSGEFLGSKKGVHIY